MITSLRTAAVHTGAKLALILMTISTHRAMSPNVPSATVITLHTTLGASGFEQQRGVLKTESLQGRVPSHHQPPTNPDTIRLSLRPGPPSMIIQPQFHVDLAAYLVREVPTPQGRSRSIMLWRNFTKPEYDLWFFISEH